MSGAEPITRPCLPDPLRECSERPQPAENAGPFRISGGGEDTRQIEVRFGIARPQLEGAIPDGCCIDAEGALWIASPPTREVLRVREGGETTDRISTDLMAIACMLGGDDRRTLYVLTAPSVDGPECETLRSARIESLEVEVPGAGLP